MVAKHRIDFGLLGHRRKHIGVADPLLLLQLYGKQQEGRLNAFVLVLLEVVPPQKHERQAKTRKPDLLTILAVLTPQAIENAGKIRRIFESQHLPQHDFFSTAEARCDLSLPSEEFVGSDARRVKAEGDRRLRHRNKPQSLFEVEQSIATADVEESLPQPSKDPRSRIACCPLGRVERRLGYTLAPISAQESNHSGQVLHATMSTYFRHLRDHAGKNWIQLGVEAEKVPSTFDELLQPLVRIQVEPSDKRSKQHPATEDVSQGIMMTKFVFPSDPSGQVDGALDGRTRCTQSHALSENSLDFVRALLVGNCDPASSLRVHTLDAHPSGLQFGSICVREVKLVP